MSSLAAQPAAAPSQPSPLFVALAGALDDGILVLEYDRRISFANAALPPLLDNPRADLANNTLMVALRDHQADEAVERAFATGEAQTAILHIQHTGRTLRLTCQPLPPPDRRAVVILRDLTQLAHLERARRDMVANVSHELATPLASVRLLVETLVTEPPAKVRRHMLGQINAELAEMTQLIDELRDLSQIESGRMALKLQPTGVGQMVDRAVERIRPQADRCKLALETAIGDDLPPALVDEERIGQVLVNLLHNATKWTPEGGSIIVKAQRATPQSDPRTADQLRHVEGAGWIKISVHDTGVGIPPGQIERVFERFYKVDRARTREAGGTGLGLAIAKHLVERHGGRIWVESREGAGSTFSLLVPAADQ
jgi:two-component system phosphate regulon sensor histidine kinase PhoR